MKITDIFKDENFIKCLKYNTFDNKDNHIKIFNEKNETIEENIKKVTKIKCSGYGIVNIKGVHIFVNLEILYLNYNNIEELPEEIGNLKKLKELYLSHNQIKEIPQKIEKLKNLKDLNLSDNQIEELPKGIEKLINLKYFNLNWNQLQLLPSKIGSLKNLKRLYSSNNKIKNVSKKICNLKNLEVLDLSNNQIEKLPKEIGNLKNLEELYLSYNQIQKIPKEIGNLKNLKELGLNNNQLQGLPIKILKLNNLQWFLLEEAFDLNNLKQDPEELLDILQKLEKKNVLIDIDLKYLEEEVYPILAEKIKEKYKIDDLKQIKDNLNLDNLNF